MRAVLFLFAIFAALTEPVPAFCAGAAPSADGRSLVVAVPDSYLTSFDGGSLEAQFAGFNEALRNSGSGYRLTAQAFQASDAVSQLQAMHPDFVLAPSSLIIALTSEGQRAYSVATRKVTEAREASHSVGGLILSSAHRPGPHSLNDLQGLTVATTMPLDTGWLAVQGEVAQIRSDPEHFFREVLFLNTPVPNIFSALANGRVDAAVIDTCIFERLSREKLIDPADYRVVNDTSSEELACAKSTRLYADASLYAFEWTNEQAVRAVLKALLSTSREDLGEWHVHVSLSPMDELLKTLKLGPYAYLRTVSWEALFNRYGYGIAAIVLLILFLITNEVRLKRLVTKRTAELSEALERQRESEREARQARLRLGSLERRNVVNQMSAMIAHEIRTPLGAITNFASVLKFLMPEAKTPDSTAGQALGGILKETERIGGIVDRVRQYAKSQRSAHQLMDMSASVREAVRILSMTMPECPPLEVKIPPQALILGDSLEIELLVFNLAKNAVEAASLVPDPLVRVTLENVSESRKWRLRVENTGQELSEEAFEKLGRTIDSVKPEGLGMGLSIVRGIVDSHGALMHFMRRPGGGLVVECSFNELTEEGGDV